MKLINKIEFEDLKNNIKIEKVAAGGSVANTMVGITYLGGFASFIGKINNDNIFFASFVTSPLYVSDCIFSS